MEAVLDTAHAMGDMVVNDRVMVDGVNVLVGYTNENDMHVNEDEIRAYLKRGALQHRTVPSRGSRCWLTVRTWASATSWRRCRSIVSVALRGISWARWIGGTTRRRPRKPTASSMACIAKTKRSTARTDASRKILAIF